MVVLKFSKDMFSIVVTSFGLEPITVELPIMKDPDGKITDQYQTYQIMIDNFTTQFKNENEFREYLMEKYPVLEGRDFTVAMKHSDENSYFDGNTDLIFGNNGELVEFLRNLNPKNNYYRTTFIDGFMIEVMDRMNNGDYHSEYTEFITKKNHFYSQEMSDIMKQWYKDKSSFTILGLEFNTKQTLITLAIGFVFLVFMIGLDLIGVDVSWYGVLIGIAFLIALAIAIRLCKGKQIDKLLLRTGA